MPQTVSYIINVSSGVLLDYYIFVISGTVTALLMVNFVINVTAIHVSTILNMKMIELKQFVQYWIEIHMHFDQKLKVL